MSGYNMPDGCFDVPPLWDEDPGREAAEDDAYQLGLADGARKLQNNTDQVCDEVRADYERGYAIGRRNPKMHLPPRSAA